MKSVCVFCGSSVGDRPEYAAAARECGQALAAAGLRLVYGGGCVGLMGVLADATLAAGGQVVGVIPRTLQDREVGHRGLTELHVVSSMHERKALMAELSGGFIALPGGIGTLDEFFEIWTWAQLGVHQKPFGLLNVAGYYDALLEFLRHMLARGFLQPVYHELMLLDTQPARLLEQFAAYQPPKVQKWLAPNNT